MTASDVMAWCFAVLLVIFTLAVVATAIFLAVELVKDARR